MIEIQIASRSARGGTTALLLTSDAAIDLCLRLIAAAGRLRAHRDPILTSDD